MAFLKNLCPYLNNLVLHFSFFDKSFTNELRAETETTKMAALNRNGFFALRLYSSNARGISSSSKWLASDSSGVSKKVDVPSEDSQFETTFPRSKQMEKLIEVEGAVDLTHISVRIKKCRNIFFLFVKVKSRYIAYPINSSFGGQIEFVYKNA